MLAGHADAGHTRYTRCVMYYVRCTGYLEEHQPHSMRHPPPVFTVLWDASLYRCLSCYATPFFRFLLPKSSVFISPYGPRPTGVWQTVGLFHEWMTAEFVFFSFLHSPTAFVCVGAIWCRLGRHFWLQDSTDLRNSGFNPWKVFCEANRPPHSVWGHFAATRAAF